MHPTEPNADGDQQNQHPVKHTWIYRRVALPILALLRMGATPEKLAWSIAVGVLIGINPLFGTTTLLCLIAAFLFRLNLAASQLGNYVVYPLQIILIVPFLRLGSLAFRTAPMPLSAQEFLTQGRTAPIALVRQLWQWEWHALVIWSAFSAVAIPLLALAFTPFLHKLLRRIEHHQYPILSEAAAPKD